mmetsp:Transcript_113091/g.225208  ORF Transcript_113091/g.225208 Transcript_113091/m.225208 type:complete len:272 (-) Transcript_113091:782-1597(-)
MAVAASTAFCACMASSMVFSFLAFSAARNSPASFIAVLSSTTSLSNSAILWVISMMDESVSSIFAVRPSTLSCSFVRVILLVPSSVSHQPLCSDSSPASRSKFWIRVSIIFFTFSKGFADEEEATLSASMPSCLLCSRLLSCLRKPAIVCCTLPRPSGASCAKAGVAACWINDAGRCFSAEPKTSGELNISMAFAMASISSARSRCFSSKDFVFSSHSTFSSRRYATSSSRSLVTAVNRFLSSASKIFFSSRSAVLSAMSALAFSMESVRS